MLCATALVLGLAACGGSKADAVTLEPADAQGEDPFTLSVAVGPAVSFPANVVAITTAARKTREPDPTTKALVASGTAPGLYGGSGDSKSCEPDKLVAFLNENPDKAAAWGSVLGVVSAEIGDYVAKLTPVVLTADTVVTNHGFKNGKATAKQSVLQAGTAVMVDDTGTPRVKCNCGNPLTPPGSVNMATAKTRGTAWNGYAVANVTIVQPGQSTGNLTLINVRTGDEYAQPVGSASGQWVAAYGSPTERTSRILTSPDGVRWSQVGITPGVNVTGLVYGDGSWIAVGNAEAGGVEPGVVLQSRDLKAWNTVADELLHLDGVAFGDGRWVAVSTTVSGATAGGRNHATRTMYTSTDATTWSENDLGNLGGDANMQTFTSVAFGTGTWVATGIDQRNGTGTSSTSSIRLKTFTSANGTDWQAGEQWESTARGEQQQGIVGTAAVTHGSAGWTLAASLSTGGPGVRTSSDGRAWTDVPGTVFESRRLESLAAGNGTYVTATSDDHPSQTLETTGHAAFYTGADARSWKLVFRVPAYVAAIAFGPGTSAATSTPPTTLATTPASTLTPPSFGSARSCEPTRFWPAIGEYARDKIPSIPTIKVRCSGDFAYATWGYADGGTDSVVLWWNPTGGSSGLGQWSIALAACDGNQVPADLAAEACGPR
jgi:hypothetical protein